MTRAFWYATFERGIKTAAQTLVLLWTADAGFNILRVNWPETFGLAAGAAVLSVVTSIASAGAGGAGPSLATERVDATP